MGALELAMSRALNLLKLGSMLVLLILAIHLNPLSVRILSQLGDEKFGRRGLQNCEIPSGANPGNE